MISRRLFLGLAAGAAGALIVPELLVPKRTIFLPPPGGWPTTFTHRSGYSTIQLPPGCSLPLGTQLMFSNGDQHIVTWQNGREVLLRARGRLTFRAEPTPEGLRWERV